MTESDSDPRGLTSRQAKKLQEEYGKNELTPQKKQNILWKILHIIREPMFLLLIIAAVIYFILGDPAEGAVMLSFVAAIIAIDVIQEWKTDKTLKALKDLSAPRITVLRDGRQTEIASADLVPGDVMTLCEGVKIPADGVILSCSDLRADESSLTGEAEGVWKAPGGRAAGNSVWRTDYCYAGTMVLSGTATVLVEKIGAQTEYGRIGASVASAPELPTPLQKQTGNLVKLCAGIAAVLFVLVGVLTWFNLSGLGFRDRFISSVLAGITLAMAMIPEEFPVILTVFLSMGAWRLGKKKSLVRRLPSVETLGAVSVLCVDKTGTVTLNKMTVKETWAADGNDTGLCGIMCLACETEAYDPMEKAMLEYAEVSGAEKPDGTLVKEYAFTNELKMMGHVWRQESGITVAVKGSPESVLKLCGLTESGQKKAVEGRIQEMSGRGLRVIAAASAHLTDESEIPGELTCCKLNLTGLIGLEDPPRETIKSDVALCRRAGIRVVMITGDSAATAAAVARKTGMNSGTVITGDALDKMSEDELRETVKTTDIFARVVPEHKMRIVKALKDNGETVAMTGDGVNDAPALKYADIGISMGKRGSEVSREAADIILLDDNFSTIVDTVKDGRRIYDNIRQAVSYVLTIHLPIALACLLAPMLGIDSSALMLLPLHVVMLELIIDPTCSIVLERRPAEKDIMDRPPRGPREKVVNAPALIKSLAQGLFIFGASFGIYYLTLRQSPDGAAARSCGLTAIIIANLFLVQVNSSDSESIFASLKKLSRDKVMWIVNAVALAALAVILYTPLNGFFSLAPLPFIQFLTAAALGAASVLWYEIVKLVKKQTAAARKHRTPPA